MTIPISVLSIMYPAHIFYEREFEKPAVWIAIYACLVKCILGLAGTIFVIGVALDDGG